MEEKKKNLVVSTVKHSRQLTERLSSKTVVEDTVDVHHIKIVCFFTDLKTSQLGCEIACTMERSINNN